MKQIALGEIFTEAELERAKKLKTAVKIKAYLLTPEVMQRINEITKQENDAGYWSYALEYALSQGDAKKA